MDILIARGKATVSEVRTAMPDAPGYSAVRATLRIMEEKGHLRHEQQGATYVYLPRLAPERAKRSAIRHMLDTFSQWFTRTVDGAALLDDKPNPAELSIASPT